MKTATWKLTSAPGPSRPGGRRPPLSTSRPATRSKEDRFKWAYRYRDAHTGKRPQRGGFRTKADAARALDAVLAGLKRGPSREEVTFDELCDRYLAARDADPLTLNRLATQLRRAREDFGSDLSGACAPMSSQRGGGASRVLRQAERWEWIEKSPALHVGNPKPKAPEIVPFRLLGRGRGHRGGA